MSITTDNLNIAINKAEVSLTNAKADLKILTDQVPIVTARKKAATDTMVQVGLVVNTLINTYIKHVNIFGKFENYWIRSPSNIALWNQYGGKPVSAVQKSITEAKAVLSQKEALLRTPTLELSLLTSKVAMANSLIASLTKQIAAFKQSLQLELKKPDNSAAIATATGAVAAAFSKLSVQKATTAALVAKGPANVAAKTKAIADANVATTRVQQAQTSFNALKVKLAQEKLRNLPYAATQTAIDAALPALNTLIADATRLSAAYKAAELKLTTDAAALLASQQAEKLLNTAWESAKAALARIR